MKNTTRHFLLIATLMGFLTTSCGDDDGEPVDGGPMCVYAGRIHRPGETFTSVDGCGKCTCGFENQVLCDKHACDRDGGAGAEVLSVGDAGVDQFQEPDVVVSDGDEGAADQALDVVVVDASAAAQDSILVDAPEDGSSDGLLVAHQD